MWELDHKEGWAPKKWCLRTMVLKTVKSPLDSQEIKPVNLKGNQPWIFIGRTDAEAESPILWPLNMKSRLTGKDPDSGKDWGQEEKGATEDEMVGCHHLLNGYEFEQTPGDGEGHERLACYSPWGLKESDTTEQLNWTILHNFTYLICLESCCAWKFKLGIKPPYDPAIPLLGIYPEETKIEKDTWIPCSLQHYLQ